MHADRDSSRHRAPPSGRECSYVVSSLLLVSALLLPSAADAQPANTVNFNLVLTEADFQTGCDLGAFIDSTSCAALTSEPMSGPAFLWIVASAPNGFDGAPGPNGIAAAQLGIEHTLDIGTWVLCTGGLEIPGGGWPASGSANAVTWGQSGGCYNPPGENARIGYLSLTSGDAGTVAIVPDYRSGQLGIVDCADSSFDVCPAGAASADLALGIEPECEFHPMFPAPPANVSATTAGCDIVLTWTHDGVDASFFEIRRDGTPVGTVDIDARTFTDEAVPEGGGSFSYVVRAVPVCGEPAPSAPTAGTTPTAAPATGLVASTDLCDGVALTWMDAADNELGFRIERSGSPLATVDPDVTSFMDVTAVAQVPYEYRIVVLGPCGRGDPSNSEVGTRLPQVVAPSTVTASTDLCDVVRVTWNDVSATAAEIRVLRDGTPIATLPGSATAYADSVTDGQPRSYAVEVENPCGTALSEPAVGASATFGPPAPTACNATDDACGEVVVTWVDESADELGFHVWRDGTTIATVAPDAFSYSDTDATPDVPHTYAVTAFNDCGESEPSNEDEGTLIPIGGPVAPIVLVSPSNGATCVPSPVALVWRSDPNAVLYQWQVGNSSSMTPDTSVVVPVPLGVYPWRVRGQNECGVWGDWSELWTLDAHPMLATPGGADIFVLDAHTIECFWNAVPGAVSYEVAITRGYDDCHVYGPETLIFIEDDNFAVIESDEIDFSELYLLWVTAIDVCGLRSDPSVCTTTSPSVPVVLEYFRASPDPGGGVFAEWATRSEQDIAAFTLSREADGALPIDVTATPVPAGAGTYGVRDRDVAPDVSYTYVLHEIDDHGVETELARTSVATPAAARRLALHARPNPFNPRVTLAYDVPEASHVTLVILDSAGRIVRRLVDATRTSESYRSVWEGRDAAGRAVASGVYFVRLDAGGASRTQSITLLR